jgi:hypothetical protein
MPVQPCTTNGKNGRRWGKEGKCYPCSSDGDCADAQRKAAAQGRAIKANRAELEEFLSPGKALARQARTEALVTRLMERCMRRFLTTVTALASEYGVRLSPVAVQDSWKAEVELALNSPLLSAEAVVYVGDALRESVIPVEAYTSVMTVLRAAAEQQWSVEETHDMLRYTLDPFTPQAETVVSITAAAPRTTNERARDQPKRRITPAQKRVEELARRAGVTYDGSDWWSKMRRDARTVVTGLDGTLTQQIITQYGVAAKRWVTRRDNRVRDTHRAADGQTVPANAYFSVGSARLMHPGDRSGPIEEVVNCRCIMVGVPDPAVL